jgi:threonine aldolase
MRQIGSLAAAAAYALDHNIERLSEDHANARSIATAVHGVAPHVVTPEEVETNVVILDLTGAKLNATQFNSELKAAGILASAVGPYALRFVTHLDVSREEIAQVNEIVPALVESAFKA